jgi:hypothetical protein
MKKTFLIQVEYPDCDFVSSEEIMEVSQECIEHSMERYFGANIMDGDYDRIKVKEVTDLLPLVRRMREAQRNYYKDRLKVGYKVAYLNMINKELLVDEYLKKMEV